MPRKPKNHGLDDDQVKFIKNKVEELGSYTAVKKFYKLNDDVSYFAQEIAGELYNYGIDEDDDIIAEKPKKKRTRAKKTKKESKNVKRKRKIDVEEVLKDD